MARTKTTARTQNTRIWPSRPAAEPESDAKLELTGQQATVRRPGAVPRLVPLRSLRSSFPEQFAAYLTHEIYRESNEPLAKPVLRRALLELERAFSQDEGQELDARAKADAEVYRGLTEDFTLADYFPLVSDLLSVKDAEQVLAKRLTAQDSSETLALKMLANLMDAYLTESRAELGALGIDAKSPADIVAARHLLRTLKDRSVSLRELERLVRIGRRAAALQKTEYPWYDDLKLVDIPEEDFPTRMRERIDGTYGQPSPARVKREKPDSPLVQLLPIRAEERPERRPVAEKKPKEKSKPKKPAAKKKPSPKKAVSEKPAAKEKPSPKKLVSGERCACKTRSGARCSRKARPGSPFCWQHAEC